MNTNDNATTRPNDPPDELILKLRKPLKLGDIEYPQLTLTEPTLGQLRKATASGGALDQLATLIHLNAKVPPSVVDLLSQRDMEAANDFFSRFSGVSPQVP